ncbi:MAG: PAS domain-containing protein, partial [Planctomycetaceae bacterium]|nr:PAS domain-containing protein [Planctomycetaceae bacterium]
MATKSASSSRSPKTKAKTATRRPASGRPPARRKAGDQVEGATVDEMKLSHYLMDEVSSAVMVVDTDLVVTYVNKATMDLFARHAATLKSVFPDFHAEDIIGTCIDRFHKAPEHQRRLLADPRNLPYRTDISLGDVNIGLYVTAIRDNKGEVSGYGLEWSDVTELRNSTGQLAAIDKSQAVIEFSMDGKILRANDNFLKTVGYTLDEIRGKH